MSGCGLHCCDWLFANFLHLLRCLSVFLSIPSFQSNEVPSTPFWSAYRARPNRFLPAPTAASAALQPPASCSPHLSRQSPAGFCPETLLSFKRSPSPPLPLVIYKTGGTVFSWKQTQPTLLCDVFPSDLSIRVPPTQSISWYGGSPLPSHANRHALRGARPPRVCDACTSAALLRFERPEGLRLVVRCASSFCGSGTVRKLPVPIQRSSTVGG